MLGSSPQSSGPARFENKSVTSRLRTLIALPKFSVGVRIFGDRENFYVGLNITVRILPNYVDISI